jgi:hypothetical protein
MEPYFKNIKSLERTEIWPLIATGLKTKIDCDGDDQQEFKQPYTRRRMAQLKRT